MSASGVLVGRRVEQARLLAALERARAGEGSIVLLNGEAGVGKTSLAADLAATAATTVLFGSCSQGGTGPYAPLVAALRSYLRAHPDGFADCGPLRGHLALLLPELGVAAAADNRETLFEAVVGALARVSRDHHALVLLDDLQWSDAGTLELLAALASPLKELPVLLVASYRSDGLPRDHGLRRLRNELRRAGRLDEVVLEELGLEETAELLDDALGAMPSPALVRAVHDRTQGLPFFVQELAAALRVSSALVSSGRGLQLAGEVPLPGTVRDAVLVAASDLSAEARLAAEVAAVAGDVFELELIARFASEAGLAELMEQGLVREDTAGAGSFRHALTREALYADVSWARRRALHRELGEALELAGAPSRATATHWLGAREHERARAALLRAAVEAEGFHAHRDATEARRQALELWPEGKEVDARSDEMERFARSAERAGELAEAARAWRELTELRADAKDELALAEAHRRLAAVHELRGEREAAFAARRLAAEVFARADATADAAVEHLAMANQLRLAAKHGEAVELAQLARDEAEKASRPDLFARAIGLEGVAQAKSGEYERGLETVRGALALALEEGMTAAAAELYQRLSVVLYDSADYRRAQEALDTALELCALSGDPGTESACVTCMVYVLRERGEWQRAAEMSRDLIASGTAVFVAEGLLGAIHCFEGKFGSARRLLGSAHATAARLNHYNMTVDTAAALARTAAAEGADDEARERCRSLRRRFEESDDHHYAVAGLRFAAAFSARRGDRAAAHLYAEALSQIAAESGHLDALAALAHALAETALLDSDTEVAAEQLLRALELHRDLDMPFERAEIELRAGVALSAAGERELALERLSGAYRTARKLGARPLAAEAAREVAALGESVATRLGRRAVSEVDAGGLSRREHEVVRLLALGHTNREIASELFLSRRTVDMHVRNILRKLACRSRIEATHRASQLGLLA